MGVGLFLREYVFWHYGEALSDIFAVFKNLLRFGYHFFSLPLLVRTWLSPWYRMSENYGSDWTNFEKIGEAILGNTVMRLVGFVLRTIVIVIGVAFETVLVLFAALFFLAWIAFPLVFMLCIVGMVQVIL